MQDSVSEGEGDCVEFLFFFFLFFLSFFLLRCTLRGCALINLIAMRWWFACELDQTFGDVGFVKLALVLLSDSREAQKQGQQILRARRRRSFDEWCSRVTV